MNKELKKQLLALAKEYIVPETYKELRKSQKEMSQAEFEDWITSYMEDGMYEYLRGLIEDHVDPFED